MTYRISVQEIAAVSSLPGPMRYEHFIKRVADWAEVWGLAAADGWVAAADDDGNECIPFWPHPRYAEAMATGPWSSNQPASVAVTDFLKLWLPGMARDGLQVAVFPTGDVKSVAIDPLRLKNDLEVECEQLESSGMTTNERLFAAGLLDPFDRAAKGRDAEQTAELLREVGIDRQEAESIARTILIDPKRYGL